MFAWLGWLISSLTLSIIFAIKNAIVLTWSDRSTLGKSSSRWLLINMISEWILDRIAVWVKSLLDCRFNCSPFGSPGHLICQVWLTYNLKQVVHLLLVAKFNCISNLLAGVRWSWACDFITPLIRNFVDWVFDRRTGCSVYNSTFAATLCTRLNHPAGLVRLLWML